jgi:transcriptional regulator with XRE-family HTH domain
VNLPEALDAALKDRYGVTVVKTPVTQRRGLTARMNQLEKHFARPGDRKGSAARRAAKAAGLSPDAFARWKGGQRKPAAASLAKLEAAFKRIIVTPKMRSRAAKAGVPNTVRVSAIINWNGYKNRQEQRTVDLGGMRGVMTDVIRAWHRHGPEDAAERFEEGAATQHSTGFIKFEGDQVQIEFPFD